MSFSKQKIGDKNFIAHVPRGADWISVDEVLSSWKNNSFSLPESKFDTDAGFRSAQLGAIYAIKSHWTVSSSAATIVMPTGTGKTEVMIATVVSEHRSKTCIVVPSDLLRKQTISRFCSLGKLREIGAINDSFENPVIGCLVSSPKDITELQELLDKSNLIITTMSLLNSGHFKDEFLRLLASMCDTLIIDESHHVPANSWKKVDIIIHNAGSLISKPFAELSQSDFENVYKVNVFGVANLTRIALPYLQKGSHVVTISSMGGIQGSMKFPGLAAYSSSKGAVITLSELLAEEYKEQGIAFNVLALGAVNTEMLQEAFPGYEAPISATEMADYIFNFALTGHKYHNGKSIQVSSSTP